MIEPDQVRDEVRTWLEASWDPELSLVAWRRRLVEAGWACPSWPAAVGQAEPCRRGPMASWPTSSSPSGAPGLPDGVGMLLAVPTILEHGRRGGAASCSSRRSPASSPGASCSASPGPDPTWPGSTTRAERDGDTWVVTGQKVWNTSAHHADLGLLLARTDWDAPKHRGITYFAIPMRQPGVEVRPLRQMNGHASFNEVFLDGATVPVGNVIGEVGGGWAVARTTLAHERRLATHRPSVPSPPEPGRAVREAIDRAGGRVGAVRLVPAAGRPRRPARPARGRRRSGPRPGGPPGDRADASRWPSVAGWTAARAMAARAQGRPPGPEGSLGKLASSVIARAASATHALIAGTAALTTGPDSPFDGTIAEVLVSVPAVSIAGGTDEIQHNILAERVLGLPREPDDGRDAPFREVRRS